MNRVVASLELRQTEPKPPERHPVYRLLWLSIIGIINLTEQEALRRAFGSALRSLRRKAEFSQEELALEGGLARSHVSDLERGLRDPKLSTVRQICEILNVPLTTFAHEVEQNYASLTGKSLPPIVNLPSAEHLWYELPVQKQKDAGAVELGRKGGQTTAKKRTPQQRSEAARKAARKRWKKNNKS